MSSRIPSLFKSQKPRSFEHKPLIYDPKKERRAELEQLMEEQRTGQITDERRLQRLRGSFKGCLSGQQGQSRRRQTSARQLRLFVIMAVLVTLFVLYYNWA